MPYAGGTSSSPAPPIASTASRDVSKKIAKAPWRADRFASIRIDENDAIAVALFAPAAEAKKPKAVNVHAKDLTELHAETRHIASAAGHVSRENLTRRFVDLGDSADGRYSPRRTSPTPGGRAIARVSICWGSGRVARSGGGLGRPSRRG